MRQAHIEMCREIVNKLGEVKRQFVISGAVSSSYVKVYEDGIIKIESNPDNYELTIHRLENDNPVIYVDKNNKSYRWHGESHYLDDHVEELWSELRSKNERHEIAL